MLHNLFSGINFEIENLEIVGDTPCTSPPTFDMTPIDTGQYAQSFTLK